MKITVTLTGIGAIWLRAFSFAKMNAIYHCIRKYLLLLLLREGGPYGGESGAGDL